MRAPLKMLALKRRGEKTESDEAEMQGREDAQISKPQLLQILHGERASARECEEVPLSTAQSGKT